ncbi:MAG: hypothetical protein RQ966_18115 [Acetobacteraceae bacterium]|nr:hypothetical protein [Acetobacteraceae bacterium]
MDSREGIMLQNQILELRRDLQAMQQQRGAGGSSYGAPSYAGQASGANGLEAQLLDRVQTLEDQVRRLRGEIDEQSNALRRAQESLSKQIDDLNFRAANPGAGTTPSSSTQQLTPRSTAQIDATPPAATPKRTPELALQEGNAALARRDYPAAEAAAREVLTVRKSARAGDANFLLAQSLMGEHNYQGAAVAYDDAYNASKTGSRAPDALLGLANALIGLNDRNASCATLDKLRREFPTLRAAVRETAATLRARNGCS